jgi:hypothetical protein
MMYAHSGLAAIAVISMCPNSSFGETKDNIDERLTRPRFDAVCDVTQHCEAGNTFCTEYSEPVTFAHSDMNMTIGTAIFDILEIFNREYEVENQRTFLAFEKIKSTARRWFRVHVDTVSMSGELIPTNIHGVWTQEPILNFTCET